MKTPSLFPEPGAPPAAAPAPGRRFRRGWTYGADQSLVSDDGRFTVLSDPEGGLLLEDGQSCNVAGSGPCHYRVKSRTAAVKWAAELRVTGPDWPKG